jgi:metallo-beta-lactamase class B
MKKISKLSPWIGVIAAAALYAGMAQAQTKNPPPPDHPAVTVKGQTLTPRSILSRNMGTPADQSTAFPPHKIIGNVYYVGTYERNVPVIKKSVEQLGFKFSDIKILLGNHAHGDHQEGDAMVKRLTGAQVMVMAEDVPALKAMKPGGQEHPIDKILHDGETVTLGGTTLVAHLTAGHTPGCTTWTMNVQDGGKTYNVVFGGSLRSPGTLTPAIVDEMNRTFKLVRALPCDVPLGDHPSEYKLQTKYAKLQKGGPNPFIDKAGCLDEADIQEAMFHAIQSEQQKKR